jgi:hypothetical protein
MVSNLICDPANRVKVHPTEPICVDAIKHHAAEAASVMAQADVMDLTRSQLLRRLLAGYLKTHDHERKAARS